MSGFVVKASSETIRFEIDWRRGHLGPEEQVTEDCGWRLGPTVWSGGDLAIVEQAHDHERSWAVFSGGVPGRFYQVASQVSTNRDRRLSRAFVMRVAEG